MKNEKGQTLAIILFIVLVVLTIGLAVAAQTLTGLKETTRQEESIRAYDAAEAGAEEALRLIKAGTGTPGTTGSGTFGEVGATFSFEIQAMEGLDDDEYSFRVDKDQSYQVNLNGIAQGECFDIYWWSETRPNDDIVDSGLDYAALEFAYLRKDPSGSYEVALKNVYDHLYGSRGNNFSDPQELSPLFEDGQGNTYRFKGAPDPGNSFCLQNDEKRVLRITPLYNATWVLLKSKSGISIPSQGYIVISTGRAGETERIVKVTRSAASLPSIFDFGLFSGSDQPLQK